MTDNDKKLALGEAAKEYIAGLSPEDGKASQQEVSKFTRWFGRERPVSELKPSEIESYAEQMSTSDKDYLKKFDVVKAFLVHARKKGWTDSNMSIHLKVKVKTKARPKTKVTSAKGKKNAASRKDMPEPVSLTKEGHAKLKAELETLHGEGNRL